MATMNKPTYAAIQVRPVHLLMSTLIPTLMSTLISTPSQVHSPTKPVLVFVSSRRQTRLTALDLITYAGRYASAHDPPPA